MSMEYEVGEMLCYNSDVQLSVFLLYILSVN